MERANPPIVVIHNYLETFREFLSRTGDQETLFSRRFNGDQALYWVGPKKLVISSAPVANAAWLCERWGYANTLTAAPENPSPQLSLDILREEKLLAALLDYAGAEKQLALIPYAATPEFLTLAQTLQEQHGLSISLPECPEADHLWVAQYIDTKVGFRVLVSQWLTERDLYPFGLISEDIEHAAKVAAWFGTLGKGCVIKANKGGSGVGNLFLTVEELRGTPNLIDKMHENSFLRDDIFVVEEYIHSPEMVSPSLEFFVPPLGVGEPRITYLSNQHFEESGRFAGVLISRELLAEPWYPQFAEHGLAIASALQRIGYVGHFDLDSIVDAEEKLYLVEINARRTGGTFAHEFLLHLFGEDYGAKVSVLSQNKISSRGIADFQKLNEAIGDIAYPIAGQARGIIIILTSSLPRGYFGFLALGENLAECQALKEQMSARLQASA